MKIRLYIEGNLMAEAEPEDAGQLQLVTMLWRIQWRLSYHGGREWNIVRIVRWKTCEELLDEN